MLLSAENLSYFRLFTLNLYLETLRVADSSGPSRPDLTIALLLTANRARPVHPRALPSEVPRI